MKNWEPNWEFLQTLAQNVPVGIAVSQIPQKRYLYVNDELCRLTGFSREDFLSNGLALTRDRILIENKAEFFADLDRARSFYADPKADLGHAFQAQIPITTANGQRRFLLTSFRPLGARGPDGAPDTFIHISQDITQRILLEEQRRKDEIILIQSNKMAELGEMVSCLAHEINNPLSILSHLLENIESRYQDQDITRAFSTLERINKIVKALLHFARDPADGQTGAGPISLRQILADTMLLCHNRLTNQKIHFEQSGALEACPHIHETLLSQILLNLINNSYDALEQLQTERWLKLVAQVEQNQVHIFFSDSGISPGVEVMQQWLAPFFTTKTAGKGTGLGLAICHNLLRANNGSIAPFAAPHTTFKITLPLWPKERADG